MLHSEQSFVHRLRSHTNRPTSLKRIPQIINFHLRTWHSKNPFMMEPWWTDMLYFLQSGGGRSGFNLKCYANMKSFCGRELEKPKISAKFLFLIAICLNLHPTKRQHENWVTQRLYEQWFSFSFCFPNCLFLNTHHKGWWNGCNSLPQLESVAPTPKQANLVIKLKRCNSVVVFLCVGYWLKVRSWLNITEG